MIPASERPVEVADGMYVSQHKFSLEEEAYRKVIVAHAQETKKCYEEALDRDVDAQGKVVLEFDVNDTGQVKKTLAKSTDIHDEKFKSCLVDHSLKWQFPPAKKGQVTTISFPFFFSN